jgi:hypothetical protein
MLRDRQGWTKFPVNVEKEIDEKDLTPVGKHKRTISPELAKKVAKLGKGQGREVKLTKKEVGKLLDSGKYALISAGKNPNHEADKNLSDGDISSRYESLKADLKDAGYAYSPVKGHYGGEEDSFLVMVHDADKDHIKELGKKYNQDSVIHSEDGKHEMHYTTGEKSGQHHKGEGLAEDAESRGDYFSEIDTEDAGKYKFALNFDFDRLHKALKRLMKIIDQ